MLVSCTMALACWRIFCELLLYALVEQADKERDVSLGSESKPHTAYQVG